MVTTKRYIRKHLGLPFIALYLTFASPLIFPEKTQKQGYRPPIKVYNPYTENKVPSPKKDNDYNNIYCIKPNSSEKRWFIKRGTKITIENLI